MSIKNKKDQPSYIGITGLVMGLAEVIPGVSGGTIAFISGIYERLLQVINNIGPGVITVLKKEGLASAWKKIDGFFILTLLGGMVVGVLIGIFLVTHLLDNYPPVIWAFFFGLILASAIYMLGTISNRKILHWVLLLFGVAVAAYLGTLEIGQGNTSLYYVFLAGMIAITALVLPGVSGSFMLLMMGMYTFIVKDTMKGLLVDFSTDKIVTALVFGLGCLTGLFSVAKVLSWAFEKYKNATVMLLSGFMIGSLYKIWPWRNGTKWLDKESGDVLSVFPSLVDPDNVKVLSEELVWPSLYQGVPYFLLAIVAFIIGMGLIYIFSIVERQSK